LPANVADMSPLAKSSVFGSVVVGSESSEPFQGLAAGPVFVTPAGGATEAVSSQLTDPIEVPGVLMPLMAAWAGEPRIKASALANKREQKRRRSAT